MPESLNNVREWTTEALQGVALDTRRPASERAIAAREVSRRVDGFSPSVNSRHILEDEGYLTCYSDGSYLILPWTSAPQ